MTNYVLPLTTLDDVIRQSRLVDRSAVESTVTMADTIDSADTVTIAYLKDLLYEVSNDMQNFFWRGLTPYYEAKEFYLDYLRKNLWYNRERAMWQLDIDKQDGDDSISISAFDWNGTAFTSSDYRYVYPNTTPNEAVLFNPNTTLSDLSDFDDKVTVTGIWGYHDNANNMWKASGDTVLNASQISATATSLTVDSATNFETYQLIRIESEYCFITSINSNTNVLTIERAKNGTTGAIHANGTAIDTFAPMPSIAKECRRLVLRAWYLKGDPRYNVVASGDSMRELGDDGIKTVIPRKWTIGSVSDAN